MIYFHHPLFRPSYEYHLLVFCIMLNVFEASVLCLIIPDDADGDCEEGAQSRLSECSRLRTCVKYILVYERCVNVVDIFHTFHSWSKIYSSRNDTINLHCRRVGSSHLQVQPLSWHPRWSYTSSLGTPRRGGNHATLVFLPPKCLFSWYVPFTLFRCLCWAQQHCRRKR